MNIFALLIMLMVGSAGLVVVGLIVRLLFKSRKTGIWVLLAIVLLLFAIVILHRNRHAAIFVQSSDPIGSMTRNQTHPIDEVPPVWLPGVEDQFEADVYPSKLSAERAIGLRTKGQIDVNLNTLEIETHPAPWSGESETKLNSGKVKATATGGNREIAISANFVEKPWVENFADFVNRNPKNKWILARSQQSCTSQAEAEQQAMSDACRKIAQLLNQVRQRRSGFTINPADIRSGDFIADKFAQSFDGAAGRIWRQAILINASQDKLAKLVSQKMITWQSWRVRWIRELISIVGITILICVVYLFLNAATRGYYTWSLRIAAVVLVLAGILLVSTLS